MPIIVPLAPTLPVALDNMRVDIFGLSWTRKLISQFGGEASPTGNGSQASSTTPTTVLFSSIQSFFHATDRWTGFRVSLTFYTSRLISQATATRKECLRKYGFPLPGSTPASSRSDHGEAHFAPDVGDLEGETSVFLTQEARERLHDSCQEVWSEVDNPLSLHGRDAFPVQVIEFGGPAESHLCLLLEHQGGKGFSASLSQGYDLGTRGGCHRSLQQVQVAQLQPQLAWFQLPKGPVFSRERAQDPKFKAQLHKRRKVSRNVIAISQAQLRHGDCV